MANKFTDAMFKATFHDVMVPYTKKVPLRRVSKGHIKSVAIALAWRANNDGICWPSYRRLALDTGFCRSLCVNAVKALVMMGVLAKKPGDRTSSNRYQFSEDVFTGVATKAKNLVTAVSTVDTPVTSQDTGVTTGGHTGDLGWTQVRTRTLQGNTSKEDFKEGRHLTTTATSALPSGTVVVDRQEDSFTPAGSSNLEQGETKSCNSQQPGKPDKPEQSNPLSEIATCGRSEKPTVLPPPSLPTQDSPPPVAPPPSQLIFPTKAVGGISLDRIRELVEFIQSHPDDPSYEWYVQQGHICTRSLNTPGFVQKLDNDLTPRMSSPSNAPKPAKSLKRQAFDLIWCFPYLRGDWETMTEAQHEEVQLERKQINSGMKYLLEQGKPYEQIRELLHYVEDHPRWVQEFKARDFKTGSWDKWEALHWFVDNFDTLIDAMNYEIEGYGSYWESAEDPDQEITENSQDKSGDDASLSAATGID
jgi:hypothetical protein